MFRRTGFTLIEMLVVIGVVAVLSVVVVLVLNPAELLKQSRDSNRLSDLARINKALSVYEVEVPNGSFGSSSVVYLSIPDSDPQCANLGLGTLSPPYTYG